MRYAFMVASLTLLLLAACGTTAAPTDTPVPPVAIVPAIATPDPDYVPPSEPLRPVPLPTVSPVERESAGDTWLYLTAFQNDFVSVVDPISGHALYQLPVEGSQAGMAVSPDGTRLHVVDGLLKDSRICITARRRKLKESSQTHSSRSRLVSGQPLSGHVLLLHK